MSCSWHPLLYLNRGKLIQFLTATNSLLLGFCVGSFLNVFVFRWKKGISVVLPPSSCSSCNSVLKWYENIPAMSFFALAGKCRSCGTKISAQYPIVEVITGVLFLLAHRAFYPDVLNVFFSFLFFSFLVLFTIFDLKWRLLPHPVNNFFIIFGLLNLFFSKGIELNRLFIFIGDFMIICAFFLLVILRFPSCLGGGDLKLLGGMILWLPQAQFYIAFLIACLTPVIFLSFWPGIFKNSSPVRLLPFAPFLAIGSLGAWLILL